MKQLDAEAINWIGGICLMDRPDPPVTLTHKNVPNGAYDISKTKTRVFVYNEFAYLIASKMWVDDEVANKRLPLWMQEPWNSYPDLPA